MRRSIGNREIVMEDAKTVTEEEERSKDVSQENEGRDQDEDSGSFLVCLKPPFPQIIVRKRTFTFSLLKL